jgi:hypothetical protein
MGLSVGALPALRWQGAAYCWFTVIEAKRGERQEEWLAGVVIIAV